MTALLNSAPSLLSRAQATPLSLAEKTSIGDFYRENGYYVAPELLSLDEVEALRAETLRICAGEVGTVRGTMPRAEGESDDDVLRRVLCIHFPHKISQVMLDAVKHPAIAEILTAAIAPNVKCMQSMLFIKAAGKPGQAWHQDEDYIPTRDRSLCGAWIAMDDATLDNGCLWIIPGSHRQGILWPQEWHGDARFDCAFESQNFPYTAADEVPVEVKAGSVIFFNGYTLHRSLPNTRTSGYRRALVNHYMNANSFLPWFWPGEGEAKQAVAQLDVRDIVMVAGEDPYAYKGTHEIFHSHVRPDGNGGCVVGNQELEYTK